MSYLIQARLADDAYLRLRVTACAAAQGIEYPDSWTYENRWELSAQQGWVAAYATAALTSDEPGTDETAITDGMILSAVQALLNPEV